MGTDWCACLKVAFLEITSDAVTGLELGDVSSWRTLDLECPGAWNDARLGVAGVFFGPGVFSFQLPDFFGGSF